MEVDGERRYHLGYPGTRAIAQFKAAVGKEVIQSSAKGVCRDNQMIPGLSGRCLLRGFLRLEPGSHHQGPMHRRQDSLVSSVLYGIHLQCLAAH